MMLIIMKLIFSGKIFKGKMNTKIIIAVAFLFVFSWEHFAKVNESQVKPSVYITYVASNVKYVFELLGRFVAKISSFLTYIRFEEMLETLKELLKSMIELITSPVYFLKGYYYTIIEYRYPILIWIGSITLLLLFIRVFIKHDIFSKLSFEYIFSGYQVRNTISKPTNDLVNVTMKQASVPSFTQVELDQ